MDDFGFTFRPGFPHEDTVARLVDVYRSKIGKNRLRNRYYEGKNALKDFGIAIPPELKKVETVVGWPMVAVDKLAARSRFDGFTAGDVETTSLLARISEESLLKLRYKQTVQSELIYSCSFVTLSRGGDGEPDVLISLHSAERAVAEWDWRRNRIKDGLVLIDFDEDGNPTEANLHTDEAVYILRLASDNVWDWERLPHSMGRPLMEAFAYKPTESKPFGQSRITRAVRSITDSAVREALRSEVAAEFFTTPQKYMLGVDPTDEDDGGKAKWEAYIGNFLYASRDEDGNLPQIGQLSASPMSPHTDYMRALAARFSGETNVPVSTLGVLHDQASSAEAIYAASEGLIIDAEDLNDGNRLALQNIARMAVAIARDKSLDELTDAERDIVANFKSPAMPSIVSQTDAMIKIASVVPEFAGTDVFYEQLGFPEDIRRRIMRETEAKRREMAITNVLFGGSNG